MARAEPTVQVPLDPFLEAGDLLYGGPWVAERLAGLADFLATHPDDVLPVTRAVHRARPPPSTPSTRFARGTACRSCGPQVARLWERADVLLLPTVPTTFTRAEIAADPIGRNLILGRYTQFANLLDLAAVAVPAGTTADGRPVGVTLLGPAFSDALLLSTADELLAREAA